MVRHKYNNNKYIKNFFLKKITNTGSNKLVPEEIKEKRFFPIYSKGSALNLCQNQWKMQEKPIANILDEYIQQNMR